MSFNVYEYNKKRRASRQDAFLACPRIFKRGDIREDGMVFWTYHVTAKNFETWITAEKHKAWIERENKRCIDRRKVDPLYKLAHYSRCRIGKSMKMGGYEKNSKTAKILGCSYEEFRDHLESQFADGMTWENQGEWHMDHILPASAATSEEEEIKLNHYSNFQPMWAEDNKIKHAKHCPEELKQFLSQ